MSSVKFDFEKMRLASLRKRAVGPGAGFGFSSSGSGSFNGGGSFSGPFGAGGGRGNSHNRYNPVYDDLSEGSIIEQFMPVDPRRLHRIWRRIYLQDPVAGPAVELYKDLPWSDFQILGIDDPHIAKLYTDAMNAINITQLLPELSSEFLTMGKVIGHLLMNESKGYWEKCIIHDPDWIRVTPIPIPGFQPKLDIIPTPEMRAWSNSRDERDLQAQEEVGDLVEMIRYGQDIPLPPEQTFYIPRKTAPYDVIGASAYTRIIMFVAYEKALVNATIAASRRRASRIRHITAGIDDIWEPSKEELDDLSSLFMQADEDPVGAIVVTRTGVTASEVGGSTPADIVKISDEWQFLLQGKLNALGVSEAFLTGEATYNTLEQLMSVFLEKIKAFRNFFVNELMLEKILKPLAVKHQFVHRKQADLDHRVRTGARDPSEQRYILPSIVWEKSLRPVADRDYLEIIGMMEEKGIPITLRTWSGAAGFDLGSEMEQFKEDVETRREMAGQRKKIMELAPEGAGMGGMGGGMGGGLGGEMGGLGGLGGDMGGLGGLGGDMGGMGGLGGDMGGLGGDMGGMGGGMAGGEAGGGAGGLALPAVGASVREAATKHSEEDRQFLEGLRKLPVWDKKGRFLGVTHDQAELATRRLLDHLGNRLSSALSNSETRRILRTGSNRRDEILRYLLSRTGIIKNASISRGIAMDIQRALSNKLGDRPQLLAIELRQVAACLAMGLRSKMESEASRLEAGVDAAARAKSIRLNPNLKKIPKVGIPGSKGNVLTGYVEDKKLLEE